MIFFFVLVDDDRVNAASVRAEIEKSGPPSHLPREYPTVKMHLTNSLICAVQKQQSVTGFAPPAPPKQQKPLPLGAGRCNRIACWPVAVDCVDMATYVIDWPAAPRLQTDPTPRLHLEFHSLGLWRPSPWLQHPTALRVHRRRLSCAPDSLPCFRRMTSIRAHRVTAWHCMLQLFLLIFKLFFLLLLLF